MKILAAIDLSAASATVVNRAEALASALSAQVWLLHVAEPEPDFVGFDAGPQTVRDAVAQDLRHAHAEIQRVADRLRESGLDATALVVQGATVETILKEARKLAVDMLVVGSHGGGGLHHLLVGSVSEGVIRKAECPIVVVPTHDRT